MSKPENIKVKAFVSIRYEDGQKRQVGIPVRIALDDWPDIVDATGGVEWANLEDACTAIVETEISIQYSGVAAWEIDKLVLKRFR